MTANEIFNYLNVNYHGRNLEKKILTSNKYSYEHQRVLHQLQQCCQEFEQRRIKTQCQNKPRIFFLYHVGIKNIRIDATGIQDPLKLQKLQPTYTKLVFAALARLSKIARPYDLIISILDTDLKTFIDGQILNKKLTFKNSIAFLDGSTKEAELTNWNRFTLWTYMAQLMGSKKTFSDCTFFSIDGDYIPSQAILLGDPQRHNSDIIFSTNKDSYPQWAINEGFLSFKTNQAAHEYFTICQNIYEEFCHDKIVLDSWKNPKIWWGSQACLMLPLFKFNNPELELEESKKVIKLMDRKISVTRMNGNIINSPPDTLFKAKEWALESSKCYHFTGYYKRTNECESFLDYCINEK